MRLKIMGAAAAASLALYGCGDKTAAASDQPAAAPTAPAAATAAAEPASLVLTAQPPLSQTAESLPRLTGDSPAFARINAELTRLDAAARKQLADCGPQGEWNRSITQPMTGPGYLTLRVHTEISCGGPYPSSDQTAITWDLATGERLDWPKSLSGLSLTPDSFDDMPADYTPNMSSARLAAWYSRKVLAAADKGMAGECADVWSTEALDGTRFKIWLDAENGGVTVAPDFPHVIQACAEPATLTAADLQGFGAPAPLIEAVTAAHAAGAWAPK